VARIQLRDISNRLAESKHAEEVVSEFLGYLQAVRPDWRAALAFYDPRQDALVAVYHRDRRGVVQDALDLGVDLLPVRLVRKFFRPSAFFNRPGNRGLLAGMIQSSPVYEADPADRERLAPLVAMPHWKSCICMPLNDRDQVTALLVLTSMEKAAFPSSDVADLIPVRSMASLALAQHFALDAESRATEEHLRDAAAQLHARIQHLEQNMAALEAEKRAALERCEALAAECDGLSERATANRMEVARLKTALAQGGARSGPESSPPRLDGAAEVAATALAESQRTVQFIREVFQVLSQEHRREAFAATLLTWYCESFGVERCSLMLFDAPSESLRIAAFRGMEPAIARNVRVRVGDGISGWVARHRKPLFIRGREHDVPVAHTDQDHYNSDSYISVPLVYNGRMFGVLNLSNKRGGDVFDDIDLDRAMLTGAVLGMTLGNRGPATRAAATESRLQAA
jgi:GAF domain-containing protein